MSRRLAIILGAMKSGTTSLFSFLAQHPQVCACPEKEPAFFARDERWARGLDAYLALWPFDSARHRISLEASTDYTKRPRFPESAARMAEAAAGGLDFRLIYLMRDPVARIESHHQHREREGWDPGGTTERIPAPRIVDVSRYATQITPYVARFGRDRLLLLAFEDLVSDPGPLLARTCRFLDIDPTFRFQGTATAFNPGRRDHPVVGWLRRTALLAPAAALIPAHWKQRLRNRLARPAAAPFRLDPAQRAAVAADLEDEMRRLREDYGFDPARWKI